MLIFIFLLIIISLIMVFYIWASITFYKNPNSKLRFFFDWKYRLLLRIRREYLYGLKRNPPTGYKFFCSSVTDYLETNIKKPQIDRQSIVNMLGKKDYIHHYFVEYEDFTVPVYKKMWDGYRSGVYETKDYFSQERLREKLPFEISTNEGAFEDFMKFVEAGWFDANTGMFILGETHISEDGSQNVEIGARNHQHIGRAIYCICKRNSIPSPEKVFAPLWGKDPKTVKEWLRTNEKEIITDQIDKIVLSILSKK